jgi:hypothetical protein
VQGQLRNEQLLVAIETECVHCGQALHLTIDSDLQWSIQERDADPLVFEPDVDWAHFTGQNIIHDY